MGVESIVSWVSVRRYDKQETVLTDVPSSQPVPIELQQDLDFANLKLNLRMLLGLADDGQEVIKLRKKDGTLVPLSCLLAGKPENEPYLLDVVQIHQNTPAPSRSALAPSYVDSVRSKLGNLEKRVQQVELLVPEMKVRQLAGLERSMQQLGTKVQFLDKRLDDLAPHEWKGQFKIP